MADAMVVGGRKKKGKRARKRAEVEAAVEVAVPHATPDAALKRKRGAPDGTGTASPAKPKKAAKKTAKAAGKPAKGEAGAKAEGGETDGGSTGAGNGALTNPIIEAARARRAAAAAAAAGGDGEKATKTDAEAAEPTAPAKLNKRAKKKQKAAADAAAAAAATAAAGGAADGEQGADGTATTEAGWRVFVGQIPFYIEEHKLRKFFETRGCKLRSIRMLTDKKTKKFKGIAFVELEDQKSTELALTLHNTRLGHRNCVVEISPGGGGNGSDRREKIAKAQKKAKQLGKIKNAKPRPKRGLDATKPAWMTKGKTGEGEGGAAAAAAGKAFTNE